MAQCGQASGVPNISKDEIYSSLHQISRIFRSTSITKARKNSAITTIVTRLTVFTNGVKPYYFLHGARDNSPAYYGLSLGMELTGEYNNSSLKYDVFWIQLQMLIQTSAAQVRTATLKEPYLGSTASEITGESAVSTSVSQVVTLAHANHKLPGGPTQPAVPSQTASDPFLGQILGQQDPSDGCTSFF